MRQLELTTELPTKVCPGCHRELPITEYHKNRRRSDGLFFWCKVCAIAKNAAYQRTAAGKATMRASGQRYHARLRGEDVPLLRAKIAQRFVEKNPGLDSTEWKRARRLNWNTMVAAVKKISECHYCGETFAPALDFHHIDESQKKFSIGGKNPQKLQPIIRLVEELMKCGVVCATCHRKLHAGVFHEQPRHVSSETIHRALDSI